MRLVINGQEQEHKTGITLGELLENLHIPAAAVVVERNTQIVPKDALLSQILEEGDTLEIVRLVAGG